MEDPGEDDVQIIDGMKQQMDDIAEAYKENIRYPKYSKPLHKNDWNLLHPRAFIPVESPLDIKPGLSAGIVLDQYIVRRDQDLSVKVNIRSQKEENYTGDYAATGVTLSLSANAKTRPLISLNENEWNERGSTYSGTIPASMLSDLEPGEVSLNAEISFAGGERANVAAVVKLYENQATLMRLGEAYVDGANLVIPAYFDVEKPGNYRVRANLFDESGEEPVSHLNSTFSLSSQNNSGLIKVHASTLRSKGDPGPYLLTDFNITKSPARPGDKTGYGSSELSSAHVQGFSLNNYSNEAYEDPQNRQRLEFLQRMAGVQ